VTLDPVVLDERRAAPSHSYPQPTARGREQRGHRCERIAVGRYVALESNAVETKQRAAGADPQIPLARLRHGADLARRAFGCGPLAVMELVDLSVRIERSGRRATKHDQ